MQNQPKESSITSLIAIYAVLIILLLATIAANTLPLGPFSLLVALLIAIAKALLVIYFFMHLRLASKVTWLFAACGFLWLAMLFTITFSEYLTRSWSERLRTSPHSTSALPPPGYTPRNPRPCFPTQLPAQPIPADLVNSRKTGRPSCSAGSCNREGETGQFRSGIKKAFVANSGARKAFLSFHRRSQVSKSSGFIYWALRDLNPRPHGCDRATPATPNGRKEM